MDENEQRLLCRELFSKGIDGWGVDASAELIEAARHEGDRRFLVSLYSDLTSHRFVQLDCCINTPDAGDQLTLHNILPAHPVNNLFFAACDRATNTNP